MARSKPKHISIRPGDAEKGGQFGFPVGARVTFLDGSCWSNWGDAGESALVGGREPDDPALKLIGEVEGQDDPKTVYLGAGKAKRLVPSEDGEYLEPAEGSAAQGLQESSNSNVFLSSLVDKKAHGKKAVPEELFDGPVSDLLIGLTIIAGAIVVKREGLQADDGKKPGPSLVADEIVNWPKAAKKKIKGKAVKEEEEEEEEEAEDEDEKPRKGKKQRSAAAKDEEEEEEADDEDEDTDEDEDEDEDTDVPEAVEQAVIAALGSPKYRKGIALDKAFTAAFNEVKSHKDKKEIVGFMKLTDFEKWLKSSKRPFTVDDDDMIQAIE